MRIVFLVLVAILVGTTSQAIAEDKIVGSWFDAETKSLYGFQKNGDFSFSQTLSQSSLYYGAYRRGNCGDERRGNLTLIWQNGEEVCYSTRLIGTRLHLVYREQRLQSGSWGIPEDCKSWPKFQKPSLFTFHCDNLMLVRY